MTNIRKKIKFIPKLILGACILCLSSCMSYLDKSPDAGMPEKELFKNFKNFQGYIETLYSHLNSPWNGNACGVVGDEAYMNWTGINLTQFHNGDYWQWNGNTGRNFLGYPGRITMDNMLSPNAMAEARNIWYSSWFTIYLANKGLVNIDKMYGTDDEKKVIRGQLLFFRAYAHFNVMQYWGGMPYIDKLYDASEKLVYLPRLRFQPAADLVEKDLAEAIELLPVDWDDESYGVYTAGSNARRLTKFSALSVLGKCLLYAGSPLMNYETNGVKAFDEEYCKRAAAILKKVIDLSKSTGKKSLQPWGLPNQNITPKMEDMFYKRNRTNTDTREALLIPIPANNPLIAMRGLMYCQFVPHGDQNEYGCQYYLNLNYEFSKNFGMKNGLPITERDSGYDPADPWSNRDPRFDRWIMKDNDKMTESVPKNALDQYAQLYRGGLHRTNNNYTGVYSGMGTRKFWDTYCNKYDGSGVINTAGMYLLNPPLIRLADAYLMYAEAMVSGYGTPTSTIPGDENPLSAVEAVNIVRARAGSADGGTTGGLPPLDARYHNDRDKFFELLIQERAMELLFESQRFCDLRRWLRNSDPRYIPITGVNFDRDPVTKKPINIEEFNILNRIVDDRHNWLPIPRDQVEQYEGFYQNPGW